MTIRSLILVFFSLIAFVSCQKETPLLMGTDTNKDSINESLANKFADRGDSHYGVKQFDSAYYYYNKSKALFEIVKDTSYIAYNLIQLARIQQTYGDYGSSEETLTEVLPYIENNLPYQNATNNLFGIAAKELKNYEDAVGYYKNVLLLTNDSILRVTPLNNIAAVYIEQKKYQEAIAILNPLVYTPLLDKLPYKKALVMDNLGFAYAKYQPDSKGLNLMKHALTIRMQLNDSYGSIESYLHLAEYYKEINATLSKKNALQAYALATKCNSPIEQLETLSYLMLYNEQQGKNKYTAQFVQLNDSLKKENNNAKNQFAKIRYDARKATLENIQYKAQRAATLLQLEQQKNQKHLSFFGSLLLLIGGLCAINYYIRKNKRERLAVSYATETRISKALHDELANDVFYALTYAETQDLQHPSTKEKLIEQLDKIYNRTRNFSKENSSISTGPEFEANLKQMLSSYNCARTQIIIKNGNPIDWSKVTTEKKVSIHRVLQELMVNMKKYSQASLVVIGFEKEKNILKISYTDNGVGTAEKLILKNGLQNAENRIRAINGTLTFDSQSLKGFRAQIILQK